MTWDELAAIFAGALDRPDGDRESWLDRACSRRPELRREVAGMLAAHDCAPLAIERRLIGQAVPAGGGERQGGQAGPYRLVRLLGRGGMGEVYLGERTDGAYRGEVAVKLLPVDAGGAEHERRLRRERQILAALRHPGIASLLDGGVTADGHPFLVMEYVDGSPITRYCDQQRLGLDDRLRLFVGVCDAVQYAHGRLVVHRDLKPSNLLVTAQGAIKLLDFGIAKLLDPAAPEFAADTTRTGLRLFTPRRAAPEQLRGDTITTATDVYALGLLLFELLTGRLPHRTEDGHGAAIPRPREALSTCHAVGSEESTPGRRRELAEICQARRLTLPALRRALRGDLEGILARALDPRPEHRYPSAGFLAEDLRRHLGGEPVQARPQTLLYRGGRLLRRHLLATAAVVAASVALIAGAALAVAQAGRAEHERDLAVAASERAEAAMEAMGELLSLTDPAAGAADALSIADLLAAAERRSDRVEEPVVAARLLSLLGRIQAERTHYPEAERLLERALERFETAGIHDPRRLADLLRRLGLTRAALGRRNSARELLERAHTLLLAELGPRHPSVFEADVDAAMQEPPPRRLRRLEESLALQRRLFAADSPTVAKTAGALGETLALLGDRSGARRHLAERVAICERVHGERHPETLHAINALAGALDDPVESVRLHLRLIASGSEIFGADSAFVGTEWNNHGVSLSALGRHQEAERAFRTALAILEKRYGPDHWQIANTLRNIGGSLRLQRHYPEALAMLQRAQRVGLSSERGDAFLAAQAERAAWLADGDRRHIDVLRHSLDTMVQLSLGQGDPYPADVETALGMTLLEAGDPCAATTRLQSAESRRLAVSGGNPAKLVETRCARRLAAAECDERSDPTARAGFASCLAELSRWGTTDPELIARLEATSRR